MAIKTAAQLTTENNASFADNTIGAITPALLRAFEQDMIDTTVGVMYAVIAAVPVLVDFSIAGDTPVPIILPAWATRFRVANILINGASGNLSTATAGVFTQAGGAGVPIVTGGSAITVTTGADNTNNNGMTFAINNLNTQYYAAATVPSLFVRVGATVAQTGKVTVTYTPVP